MRITTCIHTYTYFAICSSYIFHLLPDHSWNRRHQGPSHLNVPYIGTGLVYVGTVPDLLNIHNTSKKISTHIGHRFGSPIGSS